MCIRDRCLGPILMLLTDASDCGFNFVNKSASYHASELVGHSLARFLSGGVRTKRECGQSFEACSNVVPGLSPRLRLPRLQGRATAVRFGPDRACKMRS